MIFSNTEFYFAEQKNINGKSISIYDEEAKHITSVMRHSIGDDIFVTDGNGNVYKSIIKIITKTKIELTILEKIKINNNLSHITFYLPILKATDRFEFALEKCVELGITNFKIFSAEKSHTRGIKIERWNKILLAAMKQSLQAHLPIIEFIELKDVNLKSDINIVLEQNSDEKLITYLNTDSFQKEVLKINFFFGPEAGLINKDLEKIPNKINLQLTQNRLRAETAIVSTASIISSYKDNS